MSQYVLTIPHWMPTSDNKLNGTNRFLAAKLKRDDATIVWGYMMEDRIPTALGKRKVEVLLMCKPRGRKPDPTNCAKSLLDAMVKCRLLIDDSQDWCEYITPKVERGTEQVWGTRITITDIEERNCTL